MSCTAWTMYQHWGLSTLHIPHVAHLTWWNCNTTALTAIDKHTIFKYVGWKNFQPTSVPPSVSQSLQRTCSQLPAATATSPQLPTPVTLLIFLETVFCMQGEIYFQILFAFILIHTLKQVSPNVYKNMKSQVRKEASTKNVDSRDNATITLKFKGRI